MIGVLALQGAFLEHLAKFAELGVPAKEVRLILYGYILLRFSLPVRTDDSS